MRPIAPNACKDLQGDDGRVSQRQGANRDDWGNVWLYRGQVNRFWECEYCEFSHGSSHTGIHAAPSVRDAGINQRRVFEHCDVSVKHIQENRPRRICGLRTIHIQVEGGGTGQMGMRWEIVWRYEGNGQFDIHQVRKRGGAACSQHENQKQHSSTHRHLVCAKRQATSK
jgi:hypothetical protein